jgi:hypothetical protein
VANAERMVVRRDVPVICICGRYAKGVLSTQVNKPNRHGVVASILASSIRNVR